jgi:hypothetical protein
MTLTKCSALSLRYPVRNHSSQCATHLLDRQDSSGRSRDDLLRDLCVSSLTNPS